MTRLGLGACLADDMGLGKTIQTLALLLQLKRETAPAQAAVAPSLLVAPASLLANWKSEIARFAPTLDVFFADPSETPPETLKGAAADPSRSAITPRTGWGTGHSILPKAGSLSGCASWARRSLRARRRRWFSPSSKK